MKTRRSKKGSSVNTTSQANFQKLEATISKWLLIQDPGIIKVIAGTVIANKLSGDPVWLFIVAASGGTKTELIRSINKIDGIYPISDLTPQTFLSGDIKQKNASLLLRLPFGTILTYKDFTTVLTMHRDKRQTILSQLREIYDGYYRKEFGTGESKTWAGKLGFIAGVTSVIDNYQSVTQVLGERFIQYRPIQPDVIELAKKAIANSGEENEMREDIQNAFAEYISTVDISTSRGQLSDEIKDRIAHLATFCVRARSGVIRDGSSSREIALIPDTEMPTRLAKQFVTLASAFAVMNTATIEQDYSLIYKIGMDILPQKRHRILQTLMDANGALETSVVASLIGYPGNTTRRILEDLNGLGLIKRDVKGKKLSDRWALSDFTVETLQGAKPTTVEDLKKPLGSSLPEVSDHV